MQLNNLKACDKLETDYHLLTYCVIFMLLDGPRNILVEGRRTNILMYDLIEYLLKLCFMMVFDCTVDNFLCSSTFAFLTYGIFVKCK